MCTRLEFTDKKLQKITALCSVPTQIHLMCSYYFLLFKLYCLHCKQVYFSTSTFNSRKLFWFFVFVFVFNGWTKNANLCHHLDLNRCNLVTTGGLSLQQIFAHLHICTFAHLHICPFAHLHICTFAHLHICPFAQLHICTFAHLHIAKARKNQKRNIFLIANTKASFHWCWGVIVWPSLFKLYHFTKFISNYMSLHFLIH